MLLIEVWQQPKIADVLHLPLGLVGFIFACLLTWALLQRVPKLEKDKEQTFVSVNDGVYIPLTAGGLSFKRISFGSKSLCEELTKKRGFKPTTSGRGNSAFCIILTIVLVFGIVGQFKPASSNFATLGSIDLPADITTENLVLTQQETDFFDNPANPFVEKVKFKSRGLSGSMLLVASDTWHAHHPPELCFVGNGFKVDNMNSTVINDSINARWLSLENATKSATYWFQSSQKTTDDFVSRIWENISHSDKTWILVSVLFDESFNQTDRDIENFTQSIYNTIDEALQRSKGKGQGAKVFL